MGQQGWLAAALLMLGSAAAAHAQPSVKLGVLTDLSGVYSDATGTGSVTATRMAAEDCLAAECRGMRIEVVSADHQNKPDTLTDKVKLRGRVFMADFLGCAALAGHLALVAIGMA